MASHPKMGFSGVSQEGTIGMESLKYHGICSLTVQSYLASTGVPDYYRHSLTLVVKVKYIQ